MDQTFVIPRKDENKSFMNLIFGKVELKTHIWIKNRRLGGGVIFKPPLRHPDNEAQLT